MKFWVLKACVGWLEQPLLSNHLKFYLALQRCEKMCAQGPTPYSLAPLKVTTGGRRYTAIGTECDNASSSSSSTIFDSTSTSWSSQDSCSTLLIDTVCTCGGHCRPMPSVLEAVCCSVEKLQHLEFADDSFQAVTGNCVLNCEDIKNILSTASVRLARRKQRKASGFLDAEECKLEIIRNKYFILSPPLFK